MRTGKYRSVVAAGLAALMMIGAVACKSTGGNNSPGQPGGVTGAPGDNPMGGGLGAPDGAVHIPAK